MALSEKHADQIAALLNERNQLVDPYTRKRVLEYESNYLCRYSESGDVVACVEVKRVQWYQTEVLHLSVAATQERKGHARALLCEAECVARTKSARVLQCTIRQDNIASRKLFESCGYELASIFFNERTGNNIVVLQKVLVPAR